MKSDNTHTGQMTRTVKIEWFVAFVINATCKCARCLLNQRHRPNQYISNSNNLQNQNCNRRVYAIACADFTRTLRTFNARAQRKHHTSHQQCAANTRPHSAFINENLCLTQSIEHIFIPAEYMQQKSYAANTVRLRLARSHHHASTRVSPTMRQ